MVEHAPPLSEYEIQRLSNIEECERVLRELRLLRLLRRPHVTSRSTLAALRASTTNRVPVSRSVKFEASISLWM